MFLFLRICAQIHLSLTLNKRCVQSKLTYKVECIVCLCSFPLTCCKLAVIFLAFFYVLRESTTKKAINVTTFKQKYTQNKQFLIA